MQHLFNIEPFTKINKRDYLIVIPPDEIITSKIMFFKLKAWELIGEYPALHSIARITINYDYDIPASVFEEKLKYYKRKVAYLQAFEAKVCGFGSFEHGHTFTIYAKVEISAAVKKALSAFNQTPVKGVITTPHITIARSISKEKFDILWPYFKNLEFEYSFYADKINVLETPTQRFHQAPLKFKTELRLQNAAVENLSELVLA